jgi:bis(5'-nucleosyl)-tetraphosphatase (symmetrical)
MATYAIGDIQGCFTQLQQLMKKINFNPKQDTIWFTGDLVNRGHESLSTLRLIKDLVERNQAITILGNHDLHLLAVSANIRPLKSKDTFHDILEAPDVDDLLFWLRQQPLLYHDPELNYSMVHAGIPPHWTLKEALQYQKEVHQELKSKNYKKLLEHMYSDIPVPVDAMVSKWERYRVIIDYLTRMRFCTADGQLNLKIKGTLEEQPAGYYPWFRVPNRINQDERIIFGHWAALRGNVDDPNIYALDTGCIWGNCLTAMRLEDQKRFSISCKEVEVNKD